MRGSEGCPTKSMKKVYSHWPWRAGRDSNRVMETPCCLSGTSRSCSAPGRLVTETAKLVQSVPEAAGASKVVGKQITANRVRLCASSCMACAAMCKPYWLAARSLAMAAQLGLPVAKRAPSALLATARRSTLGRCLVSQSWHCAKACGWL